MQESTRDSIKIVLQSVIALLLGWVGLTLVTLGKDSAVMKYQLSEINKTLVNIPVMQSDITGMKYDINQHRKELDEVKKQVEDIKVLRNAN